MPQSQARRPKSDRKPAETASAKKTQSEKHDEAVAEFDSLLDEIDTVLEENAESFVKAFVQKGGE